MVDWGRPIALIVPVFNASLYPCPFIVPSHTAFGPDHVTCFDQMKSYKLDASRGLKSHSCGSDFSRPGMGRVQACAFWKYSLGDSDMHSSLKISDLECSTSPKDCEHSISGLLYSPKTLIPERSFYGNGFSDSETTENSWCYPACSTKII